MPDSFRTSPLIAAVAAVLVSLPMSVRASDLPSEPESLLPSRDVLPQLMQEIEAWSPGDAVPARLLAYPDGDVEAPETFDCGLAAQYESVTRPISLIEDAELLDALLLHPSVSSASLQAAIRESLRRGGPAALASLLDDHDDLRWELELLHALLRTPTAHLSIATIDTDEMPPADARRVLDELRTRLDAGNDWASAYGAVSDAHPDVEHRKRDPGSVATLVGYHFDGWVTASGFELSRLRMSNLPKSRIAAAVAAGSGGQLHEDADRVWLYYVHRDKEEHAPR